MTTLIIPDVHNDIAAVDQILTRETAVDSTVFLGDWFDSLWGEQSEVTRDTVLWLNNHAEIKNHTWLWGNHDVSYLHNRRSFRCSGWTQRKQDIIDYNLTKEAKEKFQLYTTVGNYVCSHAGFHPLTYHLRGQFLENEEQLLGAGRARGGFYKVGGPTWLDWKHEFVPIPGLNQIVGHTVGEEVRVAKAKGSMNYCLDTQLKHYALVKDNEVEIKETNK